MNLPSASRVWIFLIGGALAYDVLAIRKEAETLSEWCGKHPTVTWLAGGYLLAHLIGRPKVLHNMDPLHMVAERIRKHVI